LFLWGDAAGNAADDPGQLRSQDLNSPAGKLFRVNPANGAGYTNNPYYQTSVNAWRSRVWAYGLRNGFRFEVHPYWSNPRPASQSTRPWPGRVYVGEVGRYLFDEIDIVKGGENLGWPRFEGHQPYRPGTPPITHTPPAIVLPHPQNRCVMAGAFYHGTAWPTAYRNGLFVADFVEGWLRVYRPNGLHTTLTEVPFGSGIRGVTDMRYDAATDSILFLGRGQDIIFNNSIGLDGLFRLEYDPD
jgi:glucose/arabinose dehydrogenase